ncbi:MAG: hypothetical protein FGM15_01770 [Chthoniobacterales bacterium]|nr:hypothetical protein [Chthoniobacterales bacterium]
MISLGSSGSVAEPFAPVTSFKVIGVGGAGVALLEKLSREAPDSDLVAMHTDAQVLLASAAPRKVQLGREAAKGLGTGGDPSLGAAAARESIEEIRGECSGAEVVLVVAGLGGGTGSGAAAVVAEEAKKAGALVFGLATLPFTLEGAQRTGQARAALGRLGLHCAAVLCFENDRMSESAPDDATVTQAFDAASQILVQTVRALGRMLGLPAVLRVGPDELLQMFRGAEVRCHFGHGEASGSDRAREAVEQALRSPLLGNGRTLSGPDHVLVHVTGDAGLRLAEVQSVLRHLSRHADDSAQIFLGVGTDPRAGDTLGVTILAGTKSSGMMGGEEIGEALTQDEENAFPDDAAGKTGKPARGKSKTGKRTAAGQTQEELPLDQAMRGRFKDLDPTMVDGQDLDIPAFIRMRIRLK